MIPTRTSPCPVRSEVRCGVAATGTVWEANNTVRTVDGFGTGTPRPPLVVLILPI